jgi:hypothetical protein
MKIDLLEIKSGNDYKKHNALDKVMAVDDWEFGNKYVFCKGNVEKGDVTYFPWYMIMFYRHPENLKGMKYEIDLGGL